MSLVLVRLRGGLAGKHRVALADDESHRRLAEWNATQTPPWMRKRKARKRGRMAKASRKANR